MARTIINANNVLSMLLHHMKKQLAQANKAQIITADRDIWQKAVYVLRQKCNSTLLLVFKFKRLGLAWFSEDLQESLDRLEKSEALSSVETEHGRWHTTDFILRDELNRIVMRLRVGSTVKNAEKMSTYICDISEDAQVMFEETKDLAAGLLSIIDKEVARKEKYKS